MRYENDVRLSNDIWYTKKNTWLTIIALSSFNYHSSSLSIIVPPVRLAFWNPSFWIQRCAQFFPHLVDVGPIFPCDFQLPVEVLPAVLHVMQEEVLRVFAGIGHVLITDEWMNDGGKMVKYGENHGYHGKSWDCPRTLRIIRELHGNPPKKNMT